MNIELLTGLEIVQEVKWVSQPFQCCSREFRPQDTVISLPGPQVRIGGQLLPHCRPLLRGKSGANPGVAKAVQAAGAQILWEAPSNPGLPLRLQGLGAQGIQMLVEAKRETGLPIITEVMSVNQPPCLKRWTSCKLARETCKTTTFCGGWQTAKACAPEAGTLRHFDGAAHERRIHPL